MLSVIKLRSCYKGESIHKLVDGWLKALVSLNFRISFGPMKIVIKSNVTQTNR